MAPGRAAHTALLPAGAPGQVRCFGRSSPIRAASSRLRSAASLRGKSLRRGDIVRDEIAAAISCRANSAREAPEAITDAITSRAFADSENKAQRLAGGRYGDSESSLQTIVAHDPIGCPTAFGLPADLLEGAVPVCSRRGNGEPGFDLPVIAGEFDAVSPDFQELNYWVGRRSRTWQAEDPHASSNQARHSRNQQRFAHASLLHRRSQGASLVAASD